MSWYYNYFLAYEEEDGKLYPYAPFDANGRLMDVLSKSRSFASHMHETFWELPKEKMSDELIKRFTYETYTGEEELDRVKYLKLSELPHGDMFKQGYVPRIIVEAYENNRTDVIDGVITQATYIGMLEAELKGLHPTQTYYDDWGESMEFSASDYMFYRWVDSTDENYEAWLIRMAADTFNYGHDKYISEDNVYVIETEG